MCSNDMRWSPSCSRLLVSPRPVPSCSPNTSRAAACFTGLHLAREPCDTCTSAPGTLLWSLVCFHSSLALGTGSPLPQQPGALCLMTVTSPGSCSRTASLKGAASASNLRAQVAAADHLEQWFLNLVFAASAL